MTHSLQRYVSTKSSISPAEVFFTFFEKYFVRTAVETIIEATNMFSPTTYILTLETSPPPKKETRNRVQLQ